jgi:hypothetical protein
MCTVYTHHTRHDQVRAEKQTWGKRCDGFLAVSDEADPSISATKLPHTGKEEYSNMWQKTREMIKYVHLHHRGGHDWYFFSGDDVYLILENLKSYLASAELKKAVGGDFTTETPMLVGGLMRFRKSIFVAGGGGYVLNRAALDLFVGKIYPSCHVTDHTSMEDALITECMRQNGAKIPNTVDGKGLSRFSRFSPENYANWNMARWAWPPCCTQDLISLHYMRPYDMYWFEGFFHGRDGSSLTCNQTFLLSS